MKINAIFHTLVIFMVVFVLGMSQVTVAQQVSEMQQATKDARRDAEQNVSPFTWAFAGFACGCFAPTYAFFATPEIPVGALLGKTPAYVDAYTRVYRQNAKRRRIRASVIGCAIGSAVSTLSFYLSVGYIFEL